MSIVARKGPPLLSGHGGLATGTTSDELLMALRTGSRSMLFGTHTTELSRMLPPSLDDRSDILTVVAEGRILHNPDVFRVLASTIHQRTHLLPSEAPKLEIILTEILTNAIEHGNLGLTESRLRQVDGNTWFERYHQTVQNQLHTALGRIPVLITCKLSGNDVIITIEDRGMGFNVPETMSKSMAAMHQENNPTGRGLALIKSWLGDRLTYRNNGRIATFSMAVQPKPGSALPTRASVKEKGSILIVGDQKTTNELWQTTLIQSGFRYVMTLTNHADLPAVAASDQPDIILMSIHMKEPNGFQLFNKLKNNPLTAHIPIVFTCPQENNNDTQRAFDMGAADVVTSPVDTSVLSARLSSHLYQIHMMRELTSLTRQLEGELNRAKTFQHDLFPTASSLTALTAKHDITLATHYQGCDTLAGDYWTFIDLDDHRFAFALADFTGHGTIAALNTVQLHTLLHHETSLTNPTLTTASLNAQLTRLLGPGSFATFVYGVVDAQARTLTYTGCGAPNLLLRLPDGSVQSLDCSGLPLGLAPEIPILPRTADLPEGSILLAYSDALTDTEHNRLPQGMSPKKSISSAPPETSWGEEGLILTLKKLMPPELSQKTDDKRKKEKKKDNSAQHLLDALLYRFHGTAKLPLMDDLTLLALSF